MPSFCNGVSPSSRQEKYYWGRKTGGKAPWLNSATSWLAVGAGMSRLSLPRPTLVSPRSSRGARTRTARGGPHGAGLQTGKSAAACTYPLRRPGTLCGVQRLAPAGRHESAIVFHLHGMKRSLDLSSSPRDGGLGT